MEVGNFTDIEIINNLINQISSLTTFIQAIGGLILLYLIFNIINAVINRNKKKEIEKINKNLQDIKKLLKKKKK